MTTVSWVLTPAGDGTAVRLDHTGFSGWSGLIAGAMLRFGWPGLLRSKLPEVLATAA